MTNAHKSIKNGNTWKRNAHSHWLIKQFHIESSFYAAAAVFKPLRPISCWTKLFFITFHQHQREFFTQSNVCFISQLKNEIPFLVCAFFSLWNWTKNFPTVSVSLKCDLWFLQQKKTQTLHLFFFFKFLKCSQCSKLKWAVH